MVACSVLVIAVLSVSHAIVATLHLARGNRQVSAATEAARQTLEVLGGETLASVFARYNTVKNDDPGGAGTAPGEDFAVVGLDAVPSDADLLEGEILFPVAAAAGGVLREDVVDAALGMPRDLNLDGVVDGGDHSGDYRILPVLVRVRWRGPTGTPHEFEARTILGGM